MKILYSHRTQGRGAEGVHIVSIIEALTKMGHEVTLLSPPGIDPTTTAGNSPVDKFEVSSSGINSLWKYISNNLPQFMFELMELCYNFYFMPKLIKTVRQNQIQLIYERYAFFFFATAILSRFFKLPFLLEVNEVSGIKRAREQQYLWLMDKIERFVFSRADVIFTVSSYLKNKIIEKGIKKEKVVILPNAINPAMFHKNSYRIKIRKQLSLEDKIVIGFSGWFDTWDSLENLIETFGRIRQVKLCHLLLIGSGKMMGFLKELVSKLELNGSVTFMGPISRSDVLYYMDAIDIAVLPHSNEFGSPIVLFEFMGLGKAIIAPRLLPIIDVIEDGVDGLLFAPLSWKEMEERLLTLIKNQDLLHQLGKAARRKVYERHTWEANVRVILNQVKKLE